MFRRALQAVDRRQVAHRPTAAVQHVRGDPLRQEELRSDVHMIQTIELLRRHAEERSIERDARIVYQAINMPQEFNRPVGQTADFVHRVEISLYHRRAAAQRADLFRRRFRTGLAVRKVQHHIGALPRKLQGHLAPDPRARAGHQRSLPGQLSVAYHAAVSVDTSCLANPNPAAPNGRRTSRRQSTTRPQHGQLPECHISGCLLNCPPHRE